MTRRLVLADRKARRPGRSARRQDVPDIVARGHAELWTLAPRSHTARVLGRAASAVWRTHRWCGRAVAGGRWVVPPRWAPTAIGAPGMLGCRPVITALPWSTSECTRATTSIWNVAVGTARRIWRNRRRAAKHRDTVRLTCARIVLWVRSSLHCM